jgi:hypothetical protein
VVILDLFDRRGCVVDWKAGFSERAHPSANPQMLAYGWAIATTYDLDAVDLVIVSLDKRSAQTATITDFGPAATRLIEIIRRAKAATPADYCAGSYCSWCVRSVTCPAVTAALAPVAESAVATPEGFAAALTPSDVGSFLSQWLSRVELAESIVASVKGRAYSILEAGGEVPGWTLVNGRKSRAWLAEEEAEMALVSRLGDGAFLRKLRSPAQVEKIAKDDPDLKALVKSLSHAVPTRKLARAEESPA